MTAPATNRARPPFDPQIARAMAEHADEIVTSMAFEDIGPLRDRAVRPDDDALTDGGAFRMAEHSVPGPDGDVRVVVLEPVAPSPVPRPALLHLHGGGLVMGDLLSDVPGMLELAASSGCVLVSVDYRLAPEHPYPAALEDAYAALGWLVRESAALGVDPDRVVVSGVSAGGGLAAALALLVRDRGGPTLLGQLLSCPMIDDRNDSGSARQMEGHGSWDRTANATAWAAYLGAPAGHPDVPATAAPARAVDLTGLPPAFVDVASAETFRDECVDYAARIWACGGDAELHVWPGGCHAFDFLAPEADLSRDARAARARWLRRLLDRSVPPGPSNPRERPTEPHA